MKKSRPVFASSESIFLRNCSFRNAEWLNGEKRTIGKGNQYFTKKIDSGERKCGVRLWFTIICVILCAKWFLDLNFNQAVIDKILIFTRLLVIHTFFFFWPTVSTAVTCQVCSFSFLSAFWAAKGLITSLAGPPCWCGGMIMCSVYKVPVWILSEPL